MKIFAGLCLSIISCMAAAELIETVEYKYYEISPRSAHEIKAELMRRSPIRESGGSYNGHTDWYIYWRYQARQGPKGCIAFDIKTNVRVIHILPALSEHVTDRKTIELFNTFNDALKAHEKNHGKNGRLAASEIDVALSKIPAQQNCRNLSRIIDTTGKSIVQKYTNADEEYDRITRNGLTEGAVIY